MRKILVGGLLVVIVLAAAVWALRALFPTYMDRQPTLVEMPPLAPVSRSSRIVVPATITIAAIREAIERAPRESSGKLDLPFGPPGGMPNPFGGGAQSGGSSAPEITWTVSRGTFALAGGSDGLFFSTSLNGAVRAAGGASGGMGAPSGFPSPPAGFRPPGFGGFPGAPPGFGPPGGGGSRDQSRAQNEQDGGAEIRGNVEVTARPNLLPHWRLQPNLTAQVTIVDASANIMGMRFSLSKEMKPMLEQTVNEQVTSLQSWFADSSMLEQAAKQEWAKACRSIQLGAVAPGMPNLWLEVRPTRAIAAQPVIDKSALILTFGVQAETRIVPQETRPDCPFPAQLELVGQMERGQINVAVPIDVPFTEISRLMAAQLQGKTMPLDRSGAFTATVKGVNIAASGGRLLISLRVKANEHKTWFGLGAEATVHVWGRPLLDRSQQTLRVDDVSLDVQSEAAFGVLGVAARAALPYVERTLKENAAVDLRPLAADARKNIEAAIAEFEKSSEGVRVDVDAIDLRLDAVEFDSKTLRVIAEADGTLRVSITSLPAR
jgi:Domain of unknown function (DUF4403)